MTSSNPLSLFNFEKELEDKIISLEVVEINPGTVILREQEFIKVVPLVLEGSIKLRKLDETGREIIFYHIEPGESCILSITSCLNEKESQAEAIIEKKTSMIIVNADYVRSWMDHYASWRKFVVSLYYNRMTEIMTLVDLIAFKTVDTRLMQFLKKHAVRDEIEVTHLQLASTLGTAREVISRLLKQLENDGAIAMERGKIKILKPL